jgi:hypothetical protein
MALAALMLLQTPAATEEEILVVARQLPSTSVWLSRNQAGKLVCGMNQSSGSRRMDERLCKAAAHCLKHGNAQPPQMRACIDARKPQLLDALRRELRKAA